MERVDREKKGTGSIPLMKPHWDGWKRPCALGRVLWIFVCREGLSGRET